MTTLQEKWDTIELDSDYVPKSLIMKSWDYRGATLKWLVDNGGVANRKERFFELDQNSIKVFKKDVLSEIDVVPAQ